MEGTDNYHLSPLPANGSDSVALRCAWEREPRGRLRKPAVGVVRERHSGANPIRGRPWGQKHLEQIDMNIVPAEKRDGERKGSGADMDIHIYSQQERAH